MAERPILFSGSLVRAILEGRKTQTRRLMKPQPEPVPEEHAKYHPSGYWWPSAACQAMVDVDEAGWLSPYGSKGDRLWVRESHAFGPQWDCMPGRDVKPGSLVWYQANGDDPAAEAGRGRPSIHMPRWASRIDLEVTGVRVERLQEITAAGVAAEGVDLSDIEGELPGVDLETLARARFAHLWDSINGKREGASWDANPWVWVVSFSRVEVPHV